MHPCPIRERLPAMPMLPCLDLDDACKSQSQTQTCRPPWCACFGPIEHSCIQDLYPPAASSSIHGDASFCPPPKKINVRVMISWKKGSKDTLARFAATSFSPRSRTCMLAGLSRANHSTDEDEHRRTCMIALKMTG